MYRRTLLASLGASALPTAGCLSAPAGSSDVTDTEGDACRSSLDARDAIPDLTVNNDVDDRVRVTVTVTRGGRDVFAETFEVAALGRAEVRDVFETPGTYDVSVTREGGERAVHEVTADREWLRRFGLYVGIRRDGSLDVAEWHAEASPRPETAAC